MQMPWSHDYTRSSRIRSLLGSGLPTLLLILCPKGQGVVPVLFYRLLTFVDMRLHGSTSNQAGQKDVANLSPSGKRLMSAHRLATHVIYGRTVCQLNILVYQPLWSQQGRAASVRRMSVMYAGISVNVPDLLQSRLRIVKVRREFL